MFVDLASISAGDEPREIDKVNVLHSSVTGYAPLIFEVGEKCDTEMFLERCKVVWRELEANPNLPEQLVGRITLFLGISVCSHIHTFVLD